MSETSIPHIFHRIWLGGNMPAAFAVYGRTWQWHYPDWQIELWDEARLDELPMMRRELYTKLTVPSFKSNVARLEILYHCGGVYLDTDFECLRNAESLIARSEMFAAYESPEIVGTAIIGARPNHPLIEKVLGLMDAESGNAAEDFVTFFSKEIRGQTGVAIHPEAWFYPYAWYDKKAKHDLSFPNAYAVHRWAGSWVKPM